MTVSTALFRPTLQSMPLVRISQLMVHTINSALQHFATAEGPIMGSYP